FVRQCCDFTDCTTELTRLQEKYQGKSGVSIYADGMLEHDDQVGSWGGIFVAGAVFFFSFPSFIAHYSFSENKLVFF
ncbi:hypothetical protein SC81_22945, partial [Vibrio vulnificus]|uniref:hypothetical protein n=1 Tax=Vibrio vulnificus TaxID=672 RepID=UPI000CAEE7B4